MHVTKIIFFFLRQTRHADYYHRYYNHSTLGTTFGIEIVLIVKKSVFIEKTWDNKFYKSFISQC